MTYFISKHNNKSNTILYFTTNESQFYKITWNFRWNCKLIIFKIHSLFHCIFKFIILLLLIKRRSGVIVVANLLWWLHACNSSYCEPLFLLPHIAHLHSPERKGKKSVNSKHKPPSLLFIYEKFTHVVRCASLKALVPRSLKGKI